MNTFVITDGLEIITIPQNGLKTWLAGEYLTYDDFKTWIYEEDKSWIGYIKVLAFLYENLINKLNDFEYSNYVEWDGYSLLDAEFADPVEFAIGKAVK